MTQSQSQTVHVIAGEDLDQQVQPEPTNAGAATDADRDRDIDVDVAAATATAPSIYQTADDPDWDRFDRSTAAFLRDLIDDVGKDEFVDHSVHHFAQLPDIRVVDELEEDASDDVNGAALFVLPDESLVFVGADPTARGPQPLFGFVVDPFDPVPAPTTAPDALDLLRPGAVQDAFAEGDPPARQGEWWLLPTRQIPVGTTYRPGVNERPFGPSPLDAHVPREWGMTVTDDAFVDGIRDATDRLPDTVQSPPEVMEWLRRQHRKSPAPDWVPDWAEVQDAAGSILVRGTLRHRDDDHFVESLGETWHVAKTHDMEVYTADEFGAVVLD